MSRKSIYTEDLGDQLIANIIKTGNEKEAYKGLVGKTAYYRWKKDNEEFRNRVDEALIEFRKRKRRDLLANIENSRGLARSYLEECVSGKRFQVTKKFNGNNELIEIVEKEIVPSWSVIERLIGGDLDQTVREIEIRIVESLPHNYEDDGDLSIDVDSEEIIEDY